MKKRYPQEKLDGEVTRGTQGQNLVSFMFIQLAPSREGTNTRAAQCAAARGQGRRTNSLLYTVKKIYERYFHRGRSQRVVECFAYTCIPSSI